VMVLNKLVSKLCCNFSIPIFHSQMHIHQNKVSKLCCNFSIPIFHSQMHIHQNKVMAQTFILHMNGPKPRSVLRNEPLQNAKFQKFQKNQRTCI
jgi:cell division FtsZ-interacting protein ZapD